MRETNELDDLLRRRGFIIIGHRGAAGMAPENTLLGFRTALEVGCEMLELDVHSTLDVRGRTTLVVIHDHNLQRTTSGHGLVADHSLDQLRKLDAGQGEHIPILDEVVALIRQHDIQDDPVHQNRAPRVILNIELKGKGTAQPTAQFLQRHPELAVIVSSFDVGQLTRFRALDATTPIAILLDRYRQDWREMATAINASAINISARIATEARIRGMAEAGYPVFVYTVNQPELARSLKQMGAAGVFTDRPDLMFAEGLYDV